RCWRLIGAWLAAGVLLVLGVWSRALARNDAGSTASLVPFGLLAVAAAFLLLESGRLLRRRAASKSGRAFWWLLASCGTLTTLAVIGTYLPHNCPPESLIRRLLGSWQREAAMLQAAFWIWFAAALGLLFGLATRFMAIVAWVLSVSFAHVN